MTPGRRALAVVAGVAVSALGLWVAFRGLPAADVGRSLRELRTPPLALALVPIAAGAALRALRWDLLVGRRAFAASLESVCVSAFFNGVLPLRAGEVVRPLYFARRTSSPLAGAVAAALADRALDLAALGLLAAWVLPGTAFAGPKAMRLAAGATFAVLLLLGFAVYRARATRREPGRLARALPFVSKTLDALAAAGSPARLGAALALSLAMWVVTAWPIVLALRAAGAAVTLGGGLLVLVVVTFATALPSSPAFVGTFHAGFVLGAGALGVPATVALPAAIAAHVLFQLPPVVAGSAVIAFGGRRLLSRQEPGLDAAGAAGRRS